MAGIVPHILKALSFLIRGLLLALLVFIGVPITDTALHTGLHFCPHTFSTFEQSEIIPVVYGLPTEEMYDEAEKGKIALGWCVPRPVSGVCPYCRWPADFNFRDMRWDNRRPGGGQR